MKKIAWAFLCIAVLGQAQVQIPESDMRGTFSIGPSFQQWKFEESNVPVREVVFPISVFFPLRNGFYFTGTNTPAMAKQDTIQINGLSDTWLRLTYVFPGERAMIHVGVGAPTGPTRLDTSTFQLSHTLSENFLRFRLPVFGQGVAFRVGGALAVPLQEGVIAGIGAHYIAHGKFQPLDMDSSEYQIGNETTVFTGLDVQLSPKAKWSVNISYSMYQRDKWNGKEIYGAGKKLLFNTALTAGLGNGIFYATLNWRQRGKNEYWIQTGLETEEKNSNGAQSELDVSYEIPQANGMVFRLLGTGRFYAKNEYDVGQANVAGGGLGIGVPLSPVIRLDAHVLYLSGQRKLDRNLGMSGLDVMANVTVGL